MAPNISSKSRLNRENQIKRQIEAAKRLRLMAQLLGEDSYSRLYRAADLNLFRKITRHSTRR
jgi:hypothetical protein